MIIVVIFAFISFVLAQTDVFVTHRTDNTGGSGSIDDPFAVLSSAFTKGELWIWLIPSDNPIEYGSASCEVLDSQVIVA